MWHHYLYGLDFVQEHVRAQTCQTCLGHDQQLGLVRVVFSQGGVQLGWCSVRVVFSQCSVQLGWCSVRVVFSQGGVQLGWGSVRVVFSQGGVQLVWCSARVVFSQGGVQLGWYSVRVVFSQGGVQLGWCSVGVVFSQGGVQLGWCSVRVVFSQGISSDNDLKLLYKPHYYNLKHIYVVTLLLYASNRSLKASLTIILPMCRELQLIKMCSHSETAGPRGKQFCFGNNE